MREGTETRAAGRSTSFEAAFETSGLRFAYPGTGGDALATADLRIQSGRWTAIVGPNGAGKSTLVRLLSGVLRPGGGTIRFRGRPLAAWDRLALARCLAVVGQEPPPAIPLSVREYVELGRNPYVRPWAPLEPTDHRVVGDALGRVELAGLAERGLDQLSGGERQRAKLARALAQEPDVLLLDEPTAHLDLGHAVWFFELLRELRDRDGVTIVSVTHDLNLASRFADGVILMSAGHVVATGEPGAVLVPDVLARTYGWPVRVEDLGELGRLVVPLARARAGSPAGTGEGAVS